MKIKTSKIYNLFIYVIFCAFMFYDLFSIQWLKYADEIGGLIFLFSTIVLFLTKKSYKGNLQKQAINIFILVISLTMIGLIGNLIYNVAISPVIYISEAFVFSKQYWIFIFLLLSITSETAISIYLVLNKISKFMIIILSLSAGISVFVDLGLTGTMGQFKFLSLFGGTVSTWVFLFMCIILFSEPKNNVLYFILSAFIIMQTKSGLGVLGIGLTFMCYLFYIKRKKFKWYYLIMVIPIILLLSYNEISTYLLDQSAPRAKLIVYGFITANKFFPLGSGFATYASSAAADHYSKLYIEYGFNSFYGMNKENPMFLMDSYYPRILGEIGYIGAIIFSVLIYSILKLIVIENSQKIRRSYTLLLFLFLLIAGIGFGTGGTWGCAVYMVIPILLKVSNQYLKC